MGSFFRFDGPFFKYGTILADIMILSILWLICSIPIITMGATTVSLYYVITKMIANKDGYVTKDFFRAVKDNFIQSTLTLIIILVIAAVLGFNMKNYFLIARAKSEPLPALFFVQLIILYEVFVTSLYAFIMIARFKMKLFDIYKTAFFMANRHVFTSLTCAALFGAAGYLLFKYAFALVIVPAAYVYMTSLMLVRVIKKYNPDFDKRED